MLKKEVLKTLKVLIKDGSGNEEIGLLEKDIEALNYAIRVIEKGDKDNGNKSIE